MVYDLPTEVSEQVLKIEKLVYGGDGLSRSDRGVVLTPFVLPGETVRATTFHAKNDLQRGRLKQIIEAAQERVTPGCPYFLRCGGCHYQHAAYEYQVQQKCKILRDVLRRVGHIECDAEIKAVTGEPWAYRNRTQLHIQNGSIGYFAAGSHELVPISKCPISSPKLNEAIAVLARGLPHYCWFDTTVELFTNESDLQINLKGRLPSSVRPLFDGLGTAGPIEYGPFRVSRNSFFQVNRFLVDCLIDAALDGAEGRHAVDLYAGVGLFTQKLASRFSRVAAVESGGSAFRDLEFNMSRAGLACEAVCANSEDYLASLVEAPDFILADPPRTGLGKQAITQLIRLKPPRIVIVACDPATLARDLRTLLEGAYRVTNLTLLDLFPQTYHLETIASLELASASSI